MFKKKSTPGAILIIIRTAKFYFMFKKNIILSDCLRVVCKALQGAILIIIRTAKFYFMFKKNIILSDCLRVVCIQGLSW